MWLVPVASIMGGAQAIQTLVHNLIMCCVCFELLLVALELLLESRATSSEEGWRLPQCLRSDASCRS